MPTFDKVDLEKMNYGVILNDINTTEKFPIDLGEWEFMKPTSQEIHEFRMKLVIFKASRDRISLPNQEYKITATAPNSTLYEPLKDMNNFRYLIAKPKTDTKLNGAKLSEACRISDLDIWIEYWSIISKVDYKDTRKVGGNPAQCVRFFNGADTFESIHNPSFSHLKEIINLRKNFKDEKYPNIKNAIQMFREQDINQETHLKHLGYFSIIESILSHAPKSSDSADSISRQLTRNLILLNNRMEARFDLMINKFNGAKPKTVISKLYGYRSAIAHGNKSDKELNWFFDNRKLIEDENKVNIITRTRWMNWYLRKLTQRILVHALREPQLITDLKG